MAHDLFTQSTPENEPLAARMRPRTINEFVGQHHIIGPGRLLRRAIQADMLSSIIFYGPPGTGKTTLARVIAGSTQSAFVSMNAVLSGVKDVREAIQKAQESRDLYGRKTILFVDEVHRWNRAQQDALLPWVENGTVILVGATTQNPFFEVNAALVSRSRIFQLKQLTDEDLYQIAHQALEDPVRGYGNLSVMIDDDALDHLVHVAGGDARALLNALQLAVETTPEQFPPPAGVEIHIDRAIAEDSIQKRAVLYDKEGDYHFDVISAFIKSIRGSDPDAALFWLAKMVHGGEDPHFIFRRLLISAGEDIGMANPDAIRTVHSLAASFDRVGMPEGNFFLSQATIYLATSPKSNSTLGFFDALSAVEDEAAAEVPGHLKSAARDSEGFGHGKGYLYPHAYRDHWVAQEYLPKALQGRLFYEPSDQGAEAQVKARVERLRELQLESAVAEAPQEVLTYSRRSNRLVDDWVERSAVERSAALATIRDAVMERLSPLRHHRVLIGGRNGTVVLWDAVRAAPEGTVWALIPNADRRAAALHYAQRLSEPERPQVIDPEAFAAARAAAQSGAETGDPGPPWTYELREGIRFERVAIINGFQPAADQAAAADILSHARTIIAVDGRLVMAQVIPRHGQRLSELVQWPDQETRTVFAALEEGLYAESAVVGWDDGAVVAAVEAAGLHITQRTEVTPVESRTILPRHLDAWLEDTDRDGLAQRLAAVPPEQQHRIKQVLRSSLTGTRVLWRSSYVLVVSEPER